MFVVNIIPLKMYASLRNDYLNVSNQSRVHHSAMTVDRPTFTLLKRT